MKYAYVFPSIIIFVGLSNIFKPPNVMDLYDVCVYIPFISVCANQIHVIIPQYLYYIKFHLLAAFTTFYMMFIYVHLSLLFICVPRCGYIEVPQEDSLDIDTPFDGIVAQAWINYCQGGSI